jgi:hypothetical protein
MTHADEKGEGFNGFYPPLIGLSLARQRGLCENGEPYYYFQCGEMMIRITEKRIIDDHWALPLP